MTITNITATVVNGVQEITVGNNISTTGGATDESVLMYGANANVRAIGTGDVTFTRCNFYILEDVTAISNPSSCVLSYNGDNSDRTDNDSFMRLIDTQLIFDSSGRKNLFFSELTRSKIIHQDSANGLYVYTPPDAILDDVLFNGTQTWEVVGVPTTASGIKLQDVTYGFLNWEAGRLDFLYIEVSSNTADAWLGNGNSGNNQAYMWNSVAFDNTKIRLQNTNGTLYEGNTASWRFIDQETVTNVDDVLVIYDSDFSGSRTELGRYTTNTNGLLQGTYDSQNDTTGADIERPTLFVLNSYTDQAGSDHSAGGGFTYSNVAVTAYVEIRAYLYDQPAGYSVSDSFGLTDPIGGLAPDYTVSQYELFRLKPDSSLTELNKATVLAYASLDTPETLYDRAKAEWRDTDDYPLISRSGNLIDLGAYDIDIDATAATAYAFSGNKITIKSSNFVGDMITTGFITLLNGAIFTGTRTDANGTIAPPNTASIAGIQAGSRLRIYNETKATEVANEVVAGTSYTAQYIEGTDYSSGDIISVHLTYLSGLTAKAEFSTTAVATSTGWSVLASQVDDEVYIYFGIDGSTITKFTPDYVNDEVDIGVASNWTGSEFYAWWAYNLSTEDGIRNFFGGLTALDLANFRINNTVVNIYFDNLTTTNIVQTDNIRIYRADELYPVTNPTTGGGGIDIVWRNQIFIATTGGTSLTPAESAHLLAIDTAPMRGTDGANTIAPDNAGITANGNAIAALNDFNPATDTVANVTTVQTTVNNTDMRGTDGANTIAPDNTGISNIYADTQRVDALIENVGGDRYTAKALEEAPSGGGGGGDVNVVSVAGTAVTGPDDLKADVSGLSTFDPTTDTVANVTTVQTTVTNSDMRGTDGANTVAPDNAGIAANGNAIAALNDLSGQEVADAVWDEVISVSAHNGAQSAGKRLRQAGTSLAVEGAVNDLSATTTSFTTNLTQATSSFYADQTCIFLSGALEGQARIITSYDGGTKVLTFDEPWAQAPADGDEFEVKADHVHPIDQIQAGLATNAELTVVNNGVKKASLIVPHTEDLP